MKQTSLTEQEQEVLLNLICFLFENKKALTSLYDKLTMNDTVCYKQKSEN